MSEVKVGDRVVIIGAGLGGCYTYGYNPGMRKIIEAKVAIVQSCDSDGSYRIATLDGSPYDGYWFARDEFRLSEDATSKTSGEVADKSEKLPKLYALVGEDGIVGVYLTRKLAREYKARQGGKAEGYKIEQYVRKKEVR